jgi:hypothetical protein
MVFLALTPPNGTVKLTCDEMLSDMLTSLRPVSQLLSTEATMKHRVILLHWSTEATPLHGEVFAAEVMALSG